MQVLRRVLGLLAAVWLAHALRRFDRVQEIVVENQPLVALVSPNLLVGAQKNRANFRPALPRPYTRWNIEQLYWRTGAPAVRN